jgi:hypothetical protein
MAFVIEKVGKGKNLPEGHYIKLDGIDWMVESITIDNSQNICVKLHDPIRRQNQIVKPFSLTELAQHIPGAE